MIIAQKKGKVQKELREKYKKWPRRRVAFLIIVTGTGFGTGFVLKNIRIV